MYLLPPTPTSSRRLRRTRAGTSLAKLVLFEADQPNSFQVMLDAEQQEEEAIVQERLASWSLQRLQSEGYCLTDMAAFWLEETRFESSVAAFSLGPGVFLPHHRFE